MARPGSETRAGFSVVWSSLREVVIWKPPGVASELSNDTKAASALERVRRAGWPEAKLPHRLDRVARGLLLIALDDGSIAHHGTQIAAGAWRKWYLARLALGDGVRPADLVGPHKAHLKRTGQVARQVRSGGQVARLTVLDCQPCPAGTPGPHGQTDALIQLETGRYHQIRAMMAGLGAPLAGDELYDGGAGQVYLEHIALGFVPAGADTPVLVSGLGVGQRPRLAPGVWEKARAIAAGGA